MAEIVLRSLAPELEYLVWKPGTKLAFNPAPGALPGVSAGNQFTINSLGIRGDEQSLADDYRILALGGSTTECLYLDDSEAWPWLLQERLNEAQSRVRVWVGNIGKSGQSTRDHILQMERLVPRYPDIDAVLLLVGANELLLRLSKGEDYRPLWLETPRYREQLVAHAFTEFPVPKDSWLKPTRVARGIARLWSGLDPETKILVQDQAGSNFLVWRQMRQSAPKLDELPDLTLALEEYRRNLVEIAGIGKAHGIRTIFVTQPTLWRPDLSPELDALLLMGGRGQGNVAAYYEVAALADGLRAVNAALLAVCRELRLDCIDLALALAQDPSIFYDDFHFNESGAREVAATLAESLLRWQPFTNDESVD
jgi:lysophospholipase L1-like esterase